MLRCMLYMARTAGMISPMFLSSPTVSATGRKCTRRQPEKEKSSLAFIGMSADILIETLLGCKTKHLHIYCFHCRICLLVFMAPLPYPSVWMKGVWFNSWKQCMSVQGLHVAFLCQVGFCTQYSSDDQSINDAEWTCLLDRRSSLHYSYNSLTTNTSTVRNTRTD